MKEWLKTLIGILCILTILLNLIPDGKFTKYVRFYAGLLFFLTVVSPVLKLFAGEGELERLVQLEFLKEEYDDLETAIEGMDELKNDQIRAACQQEFRRQIKEVAAAYGIANAEVVVSFDPVDQYTPVAVEICLNEETTSEKEAEHGAMVGRTAKSEDTAAADEMTEEKLWEAAGKIRQEISSVYGVESSRILITTQEGERM